MNLRTLGVNADSVLPVEKNLCVEGKELKFKITAFQSGFGSGKKTVISGSIKRTDNGTEKLIECADIEKVRRVCASICELTTSGRTTQRKPRAAKGSIEVDKLRQSLAVARRLPHQWVKIDVVTLRAFFKEAREMDRENARKALQAREVAPILDKVAKLSPEALALLRASLQ